MQLVDPLVQGTFVTREVKLLTQLIWDEKYQDTEFPSHTQELMLKAVMLEAACNYAYLAIDCRPEPCALTLAVSGDALQFQTEWETTCKAKMCLGPRKC